jgi:hypothetical protein
MMNSSKTDEPIQIDELTQYIYADRIVGMGLGLEVSRLILGNEVSPGNYKPMFVLVMPTLPLMDALKSLQKSFDENAEAKQELIKQIDSIKERLLS